MSRIGQLPVSDSVFERHHEANWLALRERARSVLAHGCLMYGAIKDGYDEYVAEHGPTTPAAYAQVLDDAGAMMFESIVLRLQFAQFWDEGDIE